MKLQLNQLFKTRNERILGVVTLLLVVLLIVKSLWFDTQLGKLEVDQQAFLEKIETTLNVEYRDQWAYRYGILAVRVVKVNKASDKEIEEASKFEIIPEYPYSAKVRKYLIGVLPIGEFKLMQ